MIFSHKADCDNKTVNQMQFIFTGFFFLNFYYGIAKNLTPNEKNDTLNTYISRKTIKVCYIKINKCEGRK